MDGETLMTKKTTKKTVKKTNSKFKKKKLDPFDSEDDEDEDEEFDVADTFSITDLKTGKKSTYNVPSKASGIAPKDGPWTLDPPGMSRMKTLMEAIGTAGKLSMKKGGQIKKPIKKRKKIKGVGKALRGYGKAMK